LRCGSQAVRAGPAPTSVFNYNKAKDAAGASAAGSGKQDAREAFKADVGRHADNKKLVDFAISRLGGSMSWWLMPVSGTRTTCPLKT